MTSIRLGGAFGALAALVLLLSPSPIHASPTAAVMDATASLPSLGAGVDISFPQCAGRSHVALPAAFPFAIVGVNGGTASRLNPCFQSEYNSALLLSGTTEQPHAAVYVNTGNPSLGATWWPAHNRTKSGARVRNPDGTCTHTAGAACAYVYGYSMAQADYRYVADGVSRMPELWWLDVETTNSWQSDVTANSASLSGMVDYFTAKRLTVGIYSTSYQWNRIAGVTAPASNLAGLRSWLAGGSPLGASADCEKSALTPDGWVAMVQYVLTLDNDLSCRQFRASRSAIAPSDSRAVGSVLTAESDSWSSRASYSYQWNRDGSPIPGAIESTYETGQADLGSELSVTITGQKLGYSTKSVTSKSVLVLGQLDAQPVSIGGSSTSGSTLTAETAPWGPATVSLSYQWYRGSTLVESGTAALHYVVSAGDVGQRLTLVVTGSEPGYQTVTETAESAVVT